MILKKIHINKFRNIKRSTLEFNKHFNIFHGRNGQGKTNYLESIFYIGTLKSFRNSNQKEMLAWNENKALLNCSLIDNELVHDLSVLFENSSKELKIDGKTASRAVDYCGIFSVIAFSSEEMAMLNGSPDMRRRYLDRAIFCSDSRYLKIYHEYYRILKQRNQLLKTRKYDGLDAWTIQLAVAGAKITLERSAYIEKLANSFSFFYKNISGSDEDVSLCYKNKFYQSDCSQEELQAEIYRRVNMTTNEERERGTTVLGPHRDDIDFFLNERLIREHGSHGQKKSFIMALKMSEINNLCKVSKKEPVLLIDDMTAELDKKRVDHFMNFLINRGMQVFITTTDLKLIPLPEYTEFSSFQVENGRIV